MVGVAVIFVVWIAVVVFLLPAILARRERLRWTTQGGSKNWSGSLTRQA